MCCPMHPGLIVALVKVRICYKSNGIMEPRRQNRQEPGGPSRAMKHMALSGKAPFLNVL